MESDTVGSSVTMAVMTAKTGGQFKSSQTHAVIKMAMAVLVTLLPGILYSSFTPLYFCPAYSSIFSINQ